MCNCGGGRVDIDFKTITKKEDKKVKKEDKHKEDKHKKDKKKDNNLAINIKKIFGV